MKAVLISTKPKWCKLIEEGKKKIELRKTRPKINVPFKVLMYCTESNVHECLMQNETGLSLIHCCNYKTAIPVGGQIANGKVIGEFICDKIYKINNLGTRFLIDNDERLTNGVARASCLDYEDMKNYLGVKDGYAWNISNLVIYDKPKELNEFFFPSEKYCEKGLCGDCPKYEIPSYEYGEVEFDCEWKKPIEKAPQSWCYVEVAK